jgi:hypothetical protein
MAMGGPTLTWPGRQNPNAALLSSPLPGLPPPARALSKAAGVGEGEGKRPEMEKRTFECWIAPNHSSDLLVYRSFQVVRRREVGGEWLVNERKNVGQFVHYYTVLLYVFWTLIWCLPSIQSLCENKKDENRDRVG